MNKDIYMYIGNDVIWWVLVFKYGKEIYILYLLFFRLIFYDLV